MAAFVLAHGARGGAPAWYGRTAWLDDVEALILSLNGSMLLRRLHVSARAVYAVAMRDARTATATSGGDVSTAHDTVARALGISRSVVERARRWLRRMGLVHVVAEGRYLTTAERRQAGSGQIRAASTRVLTHPRDAGRGPRRRGRDVLPRKRFVTAHSHGLKRSPRRAVDNPRPIWAHRLAGMVAELLVRRGRHWVEHRHIGQLVTGLAGLVIPSDVTARELLAAVDQWARPAPSGPVIDPLAWFLHQVQSVADHLWEPRLRPARPLEHVHDFRAVHSLTERGCLTCPATIQIGDPP